MTRIDVRTDTKIRTRDVLEPFVSAMSTSQNKCASPELADHRTVGLLVNGSHNMVPKSHNVEDAHRREFLMGESTSTTQEDVKIADGPQQEDACAKGNRSLNSGSDGRQISANDIVQIPEQQVFANSVKALAESSNYTDAESDNDTLQRRDNGDFPGDGSDSIQQPICSVNKEPRVVGASDSDAGNSFAEISVENDSELLEQLANPPDSPATIDVTEITQLALSELKRPQDFETCLDSTRSDAPSETSTKMVRESSVKLTPLTPSTSVVSHSGTTAPVSESESPPGGAGEENQAKSIPTPTKDSGVSRSRTSTATSQSTEYSSSTTSITTEDLSSGDVESDFVEVNLQGQPTPSIDSSGKLGTKPKKKGLTGFLAK